MPRKEVEFASLYNVEDEYFNYSVVKIGNTFRIRHLSKHSTNFSSLMIDGISSNKWHNRIEVAEFSSGRLYARAISLNKKQTELLIADLQTRLEQMEEHPNDLKQKTK